MTKAPARGPAPPDPSLSQPEFGLRMRRRRLLLGLNTKRLARLARTSNNTVTRVENGGRVPPPDSARRLVAALWGEGGGNAAGQE